jgi:hypothetical protein
MAPKVSPEIAFIQTLSAWNVALNVWASSLRTCAADIGETGPRTAGQARWEAAVRYLAGLGSDLGDVAETQLSGLMRLGDRLEEKARRLGDARNIILDPNVTSASQRGTSHTYSENIRSLSRAADRNMATARKMYSTVLAAATVAGASFTEVETVELLGFGALATELYVSALLCRALAGDKTAASRLADTKNSAFGIGGVPKLALTVHPAQAMCYAPFVPKSVDVPNTLPDRQFVQILTGRIDISLPRARLSVKYELGPLVDRQKALTYGALASVASGLSYRTVERLRTIKVFSKTPEADGGFQRPEMPEAITGSLGVILDGKALNMGPPTAGDRWAPFGGALPRVEKYAEACSGVILDVARREAKAGGWGKPLKEAYEKAVTDEKVPSGEAPADALIEALATEFALAYDRHTARQEVATLRDLHALAVGPEFSPASYVCAAVARVGASMLEDAFRQLFIVGKTRAPYGVLEREARLTQALHSLDAAKGFWRLLKKAYRPSPEALTQPALQRKATAVQDVRLAAAAVLKEAPVVCMAPCLKLFSALY